MAVACDGEGVWQFVRRPAGTVETPVWCSLEDDPGKPQQTPIDLQIVKTGLNSWQNDSRCKLLVGDLLTYLSGLSETHQRRPKALVPHDNM